MEFDEGSSDEEWVHKTAYRRDSGDSTTTDSSEETSSSLKEIKVKFGDLTIYEFNTIMGDNPACTEGVPIALGNELLGTLTINIEFYERARRGRRAHGKALQIPVPVRAEM